MQNSANLSSQQTNSQSASRFNAFIKSKSFSSKIFELKSLSKSKSLSNLINQSQQLNDKSPDDITFFNKCEISQLSENIPFFDDVLLPQKAPEYLKALSSSERNQLELHCEFQMTLLFEQGPLDFASISLVILTVCQELKCPYAYNLFVSYGCCIKEEDENDVSDEQEDEEKEFSLELPQLVKCILQRKKPTMNYQFSSQVLVYIYFVVQHVAQICTLSLAIGISQNERQSLKQQDKQDSIQNPIEDQTFQDIFAAKQEKEEDNNNSIPEEPQEDQNQNNNYRKTSAESWTSSENNFKEADKKKETIWEAEVREWEEMSINLLLSDKMSNFIQQRSQINREMEKNIIELDGEAVQAYVRCLLRVSDNLFDLKRVADLPVAIRKLIKMLVQHPYCIDRIHIMQTRQYLKDFSEYSKFVLFVTECLIFNGFFIFAKHIDW